MEYWDYQGKTKKNQGEEEEVVEEEEEEEEEVTPSELNWMRWEVIFNSLLHFVFISLEFFFFFVGFILDFQFPIFSIPT